MDADLNNRSVKPLKKLSGLDKTTSLFPRKDWKPPIRFCKLLTMKVNNNLFEVINNCLNEEKKVVAIIGSKSLQIELFTLLLNCVEQKKK